MRGWAKRGGAAGLYPVGPEERIARAGWSCLLSAGDEEDMAMTKAYAARGNWDRLLPVISRKAWIDGLRAVAMLFVIFGHQVSGFTPYFVFTSPIKIPLFFMITGYVFNDSRTSIRVFFRNLFFKLIVPWFCLTIPIVLFDVWKAGLSALPGTMLKLIAGEREWYMPCCVIAEILWFFIRKYAGRETQTCTCAIALFALGIVATRFGILDFAMANRAMTMQLFILMGFLFRTHQEKIAKIGGVWTLAFCAAYIAMGFVNLAAWPGRSLDVHTGKYFNLPFCLAIMILGCFTAFLCARRLYRAPRILRFIGQNSLVYYLLHRFTIGAFKAVLSSAGIVLAGSLASAAIYTLVACVGCWIEAMIINRFLPEAVGRRRRA